MAKKSSIIKQQRREKMVKLGWDKRQALKRTVFDLRSTPEQRYEAMCKLNELPKNASPVRLRNRCKLTGRARAYYRKFGVSRLCLRELGLSGKIPGLVKSSW
jgi:small subunit ribosomal protein S14